MSRDFPLGWTFIVLAFGCETTVDAIVEHSPQSRPASVVFAAPVPRAPAELRLYRLTPRPDSEAVITSLTEAMFTITTEKPALQPQDFTKECPTGRCRRDQSGAMEIYPDFKLLRRASPEDFKVADRVRASVGKMRNELGRSAKTLSDDGVSEVVVSPARFVKYARHDASTDATAAADRSSSVRTGESTIAYMALRRRIQGLPVDGPGSRVFMACGVGSGGIMFDWRSAAAGEPVPPLRTDEEVRLEIERQLLSTQPRAEVFVHSIQLVYYDGGKDLLQPAYRFVAELGQTPASVGHPQRVVGYVPYASTAEPILSVDRDADPARATLSAPRGLVPRVASAAAEVDVGRYVVRQDRTGWLTDADQFYSELTATGSAHRFIDKQYQFAAPPQFTSEKDSYVDSVDIALVEAHGFPWGFSTLGDRREVVDYRKEESAGTGYGSHGNGKLKHLILRSCAAVPAPPDQHFWAYPWLNVFKGLHSVVGYRTAMYIDDGSGAAFGRSLAAGAPVVPAWFNAVASLPAYAIDDSARSQCGGYEPIGRASAVVACDSVHASANEPAKGRTGCLEAWWMDDESLQP